MFATILFLLAGFTALGFLTVVWRRRQMPVLLRAILIIVAVAVVVYVALTIAGVWKSGPALPP